MNPDLIKQSIQLWSSEPEKAKVTEPSVQRAGIGSRLMLAVQAFARESWAATTISITVVRCRHELVAFYQGRGYRSTGQVEPLPLHGLSVPRIDNLELEVMETTLDE